ncbi:MAG: hypothetical protein K2M34_01280 [Alphaproteobacteria bacterium]|nr:hypothetical protein [Alphaproteobacteria bacterium]
MYRFVVVCFLCVMVCMPVSANECNVGEYAQGANCITCPDAYPYSVPNANSINDCYLIAQPGEYVNAAGAAPVQCATNHYCPGNVPVFYDMELRYVNVDYIQSTGTQYIDTGIILGSDIDTKMVFETGVIPGVDAALFGTSNDGLHYWLNGYGNDVYIRYNDYAPKPEFKGHITPDKKSILEIKSGDWILDNKSLYTNSGTFNVGLSGYLFATNRDGVVTWKHPSLKIFSFKQWRNGDLVLDLIPVYDLKTGQYGMWENVGQRFLGNIGTGEFVGGKHLTEFDTDGSIDCATATDNVAPYSPAGSDNVQNCGYVLHIGENRDLYLHMEKRTRPSLAVQVKNNVFYADTSTEEHGALRIEYNGQKLSVYNMDVDD